MSNRIFYACHAVDIDGLTVTGAQSVSLNTNFNLEQVFELGRLAIYDNISVDPEVEITVNKALDGRDLIWNLFIGGVGGEADEPANGCIVDNSNVQSEIRLGVGNDTNAVLNTTTQIVMSGCYVSSLNYAFPVDGNFTEEVVFVGSSRNCIADNDVTPPGGVQLTHSPLNRVLRRQNFQLHATSTLPVAVRNKNLTNCTISASLNREKMFRLGQFAPFHRFVNFPIEITVTFDTIPTNGNLCDGSPDFAPITSPCVGVNVSPEPIKIKLCNDTGTIVYEFDLGAKATLQSIAYSGGDTGGGNVTETYTYQVFNDLCITGPFGDLV
ncbi:hypothetical protein EB001_24995 [bacterium]|nr:hypothetical protein [bacterium]